MFLCVQINEYKHQRRGGRPSSPGMMVMVYKVELDSSGRPQWVLHDPKAWWCCGYSNCEDRCRKWVAKNYPDTPVIASAGHRKRVSMTEAKRLVDVVPPACLDRLTELLYESRNAFAE